MDSTNKAIYQTTIGTFLVAFGVYGYECFVAKTVPFKHALPPFIVAGTTPHSFFLSKRPSLRPTTMLASFLLLLLLQLTT